jgi:hypothetical protein
MGSSAKKLTRLLLTLTLAVTAFNTGCAVHARVYDSYDHGYRAWAPESGFYVRWEHETHRSHKDFNKRSEQDKNAYWKWRHDHDQH